MKKKMKKIMKKTWKKSRKNQKKNQKKSKTKNHYVFIRRIIIKSRLILRTPFSIFQDYCA